MKSEPEEPPSPAKPLVGIVGPCAAGKSTLIASLTSLGFRTRHIAQEHSYVRDMWQRLTKPDILIFLDASYTVTCQRRKLDWTEADWQEQQQRLSHARAHADLYIDTTVLNAQEVLDLVVEFFHKKSGEYSGS